MHALHLFSMYCSILVAFICNTRFALSEMELRVCKPMCTELAVCCAHCSFSVRRGKCSHLPLFLGGFADIFTELYCRCDPLFSKVTQLCYLYLFCFGLSRRMEFIEPRPWVHDVSFVSIDAHVYFGIFKSPNLKESCHPTASVLLKFWNI